MAASTASSSSSSSSSSSYRSRIIRRSLHDVFLSFRGADTRTSFTSHLLAALDRQGFSTFRDDTKLRSGEDISSELLKAIKVSRVSIVVFSKNYAASRWCLDELVKIMECKRDFNQIVLPIFYDVDPSHVRAQLGSYSEAFSKHNDRVKDRELHGKIMEGWRALKQIVLPIFYDVDPSQDRVKEPRLSMERVEIWRAALTEAANLSGYDLQHGDETKLIKEVVEEIVKRLDRLYCHIATHPVGIESRVQKLKSMLMLGRKDIRMVGIWGIGGMGKTTIAKAIFNCIRDEFEGSSFLADVSESAKTSSGMVKLQEQLLSNILMNETFNLDNYHQGIEVIKQKICHRRVLLVLDDVEDVQQLKRLAINPDLFCSGSRIIITTRNMTILTYLKVDSVYSPKELNEDESLKLFSWNAFKIDYPKESHRKISNEIVAYAEGLPLVLEVLGSFLNDRSIQEWQSELDKLKSILNGDIHQKLKISFDSLDDKNQELFLDIAFFFIGRDKDFTVKVLEDSRCFPESGIGELARRCLVRVEGENKLLRMHDVLRDMGREIVRQQSLKAPGQRSRLWDREEVLQVLRDCTGTKAIEGLSLELPALNNEHVNTMALANMSNIRLLHLNNLQRLSGTNYITTSRNLKWLCWHGFPLAFIPTALYMENMVAIDLQYSKLKQIWKGSKVLSKLRFLDLSHSYHLTETPDFSGLKSVEMLLLNDCTSLQKVHNSIGCLGKLLMLNMANCINLSKVPFSLFMLKSLEKLDFSGCSKLGELADSKVGFSMFRQRITECQEYIPISMASVQGLNCLQELHLANCNMEYIPNGIGSLITLKVVDLSGNKFCSLPSNFSHLSRLQDLRLDRCLQLKSLTNLPKNLMILKANNCISLEAASDVGSTMRLEFSNCPKLNGKSLCNNFKRNIISVLQGRPAPDIYGLIFCGGELPNDIQFQCNGQRRLSFVVPPIVGKKIVGLILCAVVLNHSSFRGFEIVNKTKRRSTRDYPTWPIWLWWPEIVIDENHVLIGYESLRSQKFILEGGDEADLMFGLHGYAMVKRFGLSLIYEDDDTFLESNNKQAN